VGRKKPLTPPPPIRYTTPLNSIKEEKEIKEKLKEIIKKLESTYAYQVYVGKEYTKKDLITELETLIKDEGEEK